MIHRRRIAAQTLQLDSKTIDSNTKPMCCDDKAKSPISRSEEKCVRFESKLQIYIIPSNCIQRSSKNCRYGKRELHKFQLCYQRMIHRMNKESDDDDSDTDTTQNDIAGFDCPVLLNGKFVSLKGEEADRTHIIRAILDAQAKQKNLKITSSMYIPILSKKLSKKDVKAAYMVGLRNENNVHTYCIL